MQRPGWRSIFAGMQTAHVFINATTRSRGNGIIQVKQPLEICVMNTKPKLPMILFTLVLLMALADSALAQSNGYLGQLSANPYGANSTSNPHGQHGSKYSAESINNPYSKHGSPYSNESVSNPYATDAPKLYDSQGNYRGKLSSNRYDADSVSNPYGRYGSEYSADSINNPYGAGNPYRSDSPSNPYGEGLSIYGDEE